MARLPKFVSTQAAFRAALQAYAGIIPPLAVTETVTAQQALRRGRLLLCWGPMAVLFGGWALSAVLAGLLRAAAIAAPNWLGAVAVGAPIVGAWLWWSFAAPRWRIWAMRHCAEWPVVKAFAILGQCMWPDGSVFNRTEIMIARQRAERQHLEEQWRVALTRYATTAGERGADAVAARY